eukprot:scaffold8245_cov97-Isochrysis_galbana.AAC.1
MAAPSGGGWFSSSRSANPPTKEEAGSSIFDSLWTTVTGDEKYDVQDKRVTVLQLHIKELNKQMQEQAKELSVAGAAIKEFEAKARAHAPMERKLFAKLETTQAELRKAREAKRRAEVAAQAQADELAALLADRGSSGASTAVASSPSDNPATASGGTAAHADADGAGESALGTPGRCALLLRATVAQLDATKALQRDAEAAAEELELRVVHAEAALRRSEEEAERAAEAAREADRRVAIQLAKASGPSDLSLPPPTKGGDLGAQYHILQLNFRHVSAELARKVSVAESVAAQWDLLVAKLSAAEAAAKASREAARAEARERAERANRRLAAQADELKRQGEAIEALRSA